MAIAKLWDKLSGWLFAGAAVLSFLILGGIAASLVINSLPVVEEVGLLKMLLGREWRPTYIPPSFGMVPLILASLMVSGSALLISVVFGVGAALYLSEAAPKWARDLVESVLELLAGIPSVVYGFFAMVVLGPFLQEIFDLPVGLCAATAFITLSVMVLPTVSSLSYEAVAAVPLELREASLALGATKWETLWGVVIRRALPGIAVAIILGFGRAIGETMTVLMAAGGAAQIPRSFFDPVRPMTATIAAEMGETPVGSLHYYALFAVGLVLFLITLGFNLLGQQLRAKVIRE